MLGKNKKPQKVILYIIDKFPIVTETFIYNEITQLCDKGLKMGVIALRKNRNNIYCGNMKRIYFVKCLTQVCPSPFFINFFLIGVQYALKNLFNKKRNTVDFGSQLKNIKVYIISHIIAEYCATNSITHIHAHFASFPTDIAMKVSNMTNIPFSFSAHAQDIYVNSKRLKEKIKAASFVITCTKYNKKYLESIVSKCGYKKNIYHAYHGIDIDIWRYKSKRFAEDKIIQVLTVARLVEKKGLVYLIEAISILKNRRYDIVCQIVGEGVLQQKLGEKIKYFGCNDIVRIVPFVTPTVLERYYHNCDVFVLPCIIADNNDRDGLPNVLIEAMATGTPVIATGISAIPEIIEHEITGLVVKEKDPAGIANAIERISNDKKLYESIILNGRKKVESNFNFMYWNNRLYNLFKRESCSNA